MSGMKPAHPFLQLNFFSTVTLAAMLLAYSPTGIRADENGGAALKANLTAYYIAKVKKVKKGKGVSVWVTNVSGERIRYWMESGDYKRAKVEAVATGIDNEGNWRSAYLANNGEWMELPPGSMGMGNRMNPLVPWIHVAADQSIHPFGSMIFCKEFVGHETVDGTVLDGYFWVADVGGAIKGKSRFDVFVGNEEYFKKVIERRDKLDLEPTADFVIHKFPSAPEGLNPAVIKGVKAILKGKKYPVADDASSDDDIKESLIAFQKRNPKIPKAEYGNRRGATTQWFLMAAAHELAKE